MPLFRYSIINVNDTTISGEIVGIERAPSVQHLAFRLLNKGYIIRDIRLATDEDIQIFKLKINRDRILYGSSYHELPEATWVRQVKPRRRLKLWLLTLIVLALSIWLIIRGG